MMQDASTSPKLIWNDSLATGFPAVDEQHVLLCSLANRLLDHPGALVRDELVVDILTDLGKFLILHFQTEEAMMRGLGIPREEYEQHVRAHNQIIDEYAELNLAAARGKHHTATQIFSIVKQWIWDHLHTGDASIRNYVSASSSADSRP